MGQEELDAAGVLLAEEPDVEPDDPEDDEPDEDEPDDEDEESADGDDSDFAGLLAAAVSEPDERESVR
ncbi:hypothetical protein O7600_22470 [Micromonospora sp. WMMA1998]|nr:hypothetical protein [Micromonospora sp. WMMA1998]WBC13862.1 hypothetical protein O7600_22470 [Micromonospora sp. WMMA1998]